MADPQSTIDPQRSRSAGVVWLLVVALLLAVATLFLLNATSAADPWINHDVGYHTYLGEEMARGRQLYIDLKEDNPPGSPLLLGAIFALSEALALPDFLAPHLFVLLLGLAGVGLLRYALRGRESDTVWALTTLAYLLLLLRAGFSNSLYPAAPALPYDFAQREHLFSLLLLPYLLVRMNRRRSPWWFLLFAVLLGYVATFKPFWAPMLLLVELFVRRRNGGWDRVAPTLLFGAALPALLLAMHSPASLLRFLTENLPMYLRGGYDFYATSFSSFVRSGLHTQMLFGAALLLVACWLARQRSWGERALFVALASVAYFAVWHQHKFWSYHTLPFFALTIVPAVYLLASAASRFESVRRARAFLCALALALLLLDGSAVVNTARMLNRYPPLGAFLRPIVEPYERVIYFSMSVMVQYPALRLRREMVGPWTVLLDLPELLAIADEPERERRLQAYAAELRQTIEREQPELIAFSPYGQALPPGTTLHELFRERGVVPSQRYRRVTAVALGSRNPEASRWIFYRRVGLR